MSNKVIINRVEVQRRRDEALRAVLCLFTNVHEEVAKDVHQKVADAMAAYEWVIGEPPENSHPDEWNPRAESFHQERLNWIAEVERLQEYIKGIETELIQLRDNPDDK